MKLLEALQPRNTWATPTAIARIDAPGFQMLIIIQLPPGADPFSDQQIVESMLIDTKSHALLGDAHDTTIAYWERCYPDTEWTVV